MAAVDRRAIPAMDALLAEAPVVAAAARLGRPRLKRALAVAAAAARAGELDPADIVAAALAGLPVSASSLRPVLNATGTVLHTNLGRAALSAAAVDAVVAAAGPVDVEFDLVTGRRAPRGRAALAAVQAALPAGTEVLVVNNGAAALLLVIAALCPRGRREVVWSRGELVEIGDGFRLPDLVRAAGARIVEVGTTNRTTVADYAQALGPATGCVLKVHPSNFAVTGFTASVGAAELAAAMHAAAGRPTGAAGVDGPAAAPAAAVPLVVDVGSGLLRPHPLLPGEPDVSTALAAGADLVTASTDKLLGGPQGGLVAGRADLVHRLRRHPLYRALRVDKLTLAALEATVDGPPTPTAAALAAEPAALRARAEDIAAALRAAGVDASVVDSDGVVGGGGAPGRTLPGAAVAVPGTFAAPLRTGVPAVVGRAAGRALLLDLRAVPAAADGELTAAVLRAAAGVAAGGAARGAAGGA